MIQVLINAVGVSFFTLGWYALTRKNMLAYKLRLGLERKLSGTWMYKPVIGCLMCYPSFWGTIVFWSVNPWTYGNIPVWIAACVIAVFFNYALKMKIWPGL